jgi:hypothetical protein
VSAVEKLLELAGQSRTTLVEDPAGEMVLAARTALREVRAYLADSSDDDEDDGKGGDDHSSHGTYKALVKRGMDAKKAASMCAKADNRVKAAMLAEAADVALSSLATPQHDWVEATAAGPDALKLAAGQDDWADPGYAGKRRFRIDTEPNIRLALSYVHQDAHMAGYTQDQRAAIQGRVIAAAARHSIVLEADGERIAAGVLAGLSGVTAAEREQLGLSGPELEQAADLVALAKKAVDGGGIVMNHAPFTGPHSHGHFKSDVHDHPHQHFGDNHHDGGPAHRPGSKPGGRAGW